MATIDRGPDQGPSAPLVERLTRDLVRGAVAEIEAINHALEDHLRTARAVAAERKEHLDVATAALNRSQQRVDDLEAQLEAMGDVGELERANRRLREDLAKAEAHGTELTELNAELNETLQEALDRASRHESHAGEAKRNLDLAGTKISDLSGRVRDLENRLQVAEESARDRDDRLRASEVVVSQLGQSTADLRRELDEARQAAMEAVDFITELETQNGELREQMDGANARLAEADRHRNADAEQRKGLEAGIEELRAELAEATTAAAELRRQVDDADRTIDRLHLDVQAAHRAREAVASDAAAAMESVRRRLHDAEVEIEESTATARGEATTRFEPLGSSQLVAALGGERTALVLDGDALAELALPESDVDVRRSQLVSSLAELVADTPATVEVVFDAAVSPSLAMEHTPDRVGVRVSPSGVPLDRSLAQAADGIPYGSIVYVAHAEEAAPSARRRTEPVGLTSVLGALGGELVMRAAVVDPAAGDGAEPRDVATTDGTDVSGPGGGDDSEPVVADDDPPEPAWAAPTDSDGPDGDDDDGGRRRWWRHEG